MQTQTLQFTDEQLDAMTDRQARKLINELAAIHPDLVPAIYEMTLIASPNAGPVRILREILAALD